MGACEFKDVFPRGERIEIIDPKPETPWCTLEGEWRIDGERDLAPA